MHSLSTLVNFFVMIPAFSTKIPVTGRSGIELKICKYENVHRISCFVMNFLLHIGRLLDLDIWRNQMFKDLPNTLFHTQIFLFVSVIVLA